MAYATIIFEEGDQVIADESGEDFSDEDGATVFVAGDVLTIESVDLEDVSNPIPTTLLTFVGIEGEWDALNFRLHPDTPLYNVQQVLDLVKKGE